MASGDVAIELPSALVTTDSSERVATGGGRQLTVFLATIPDGSAFGNYSVSVERKGNFVGSPETFFDSGKRYKITFTEV